MAKTRKYVLNPRTLAYEVKNRSKKLRVMRSVALLAASMACAVLYFWIYTSVLGLDLPKTVMLKKKNAGWRSKMEVLNTRLDRYDEALDALQMRGDDI